jgi:hypothetical protein
MNDTHKFLIVLRDNSENELQCREKASAIFVGSAMMTKSGLDVEMVDSEPQNVSALNENGATIVGTLNDNNRVKAVHPKHPKEMRGARRRPSRRPSLPGKATASTSPEKALDSAVDCAKLLIRVNRIKMRNTLSSGGWFELPVSTLAFSRRV